MSMSGQRLLELEQARKEQLRLAQVRAESMGVVDACEATLREVRDVSVQQLAANELREVASTLAAARAQVEGSPDAAIATLAGVQERMHAAIVRGEARARAWSDEQAQAVARARGAVQRAGVVAALGGDRGVGASAEKALLSAEAGDLAGFSSLLAVSAGDLADVRAAALDESVRREVVKGLLRSLKDMGFVTVGPQLSNGVVTLEGRLASGRRARFEVSVEGRMSFDLDGYEGRACAADMEKVEVSLRDRFGVKLGPPQVVWKNPDRLSKGAKDVPGGNTRTRG